MTGDIMINNGFRKERVQPRPRRVKFDMPSGSRRQHFVDNDLVMSHFIAVLSATFPEGEDFFIRSVRNYRGAITDAGLLSAVNGFIAQEATHRHQHRLLNDRLQAMGYPTRRIDRHVGRLISRLENRLSAELRLSMTAALEHYTATLAEIILTSQDAQKLIGQSEVRSILLWHAFEESEHKAVAFDVYHTIGGTYRMRVRGMRVASAILFTELIAQTALSMAADRASYNPIRLCRSLHRFAHTPMFTADALRRFGSYTGLGFHPDDWDSTEVLRHWSSELFEADGSQKVASSLTE
jgi:predicted metal-dependent hydrolase